MADSSPPNDLMNIMDETAKPRMLIVDDQPVNIQALYAVFGTSFQVFMAINGEQAIKVALQERPDIILLDVILPDINGHDVCLKLKKMPETADIPILFVTAQSDPDEETRALEVGGMDFIQKPINPAVVRARVNTQMTLKRQTDLLKRMAFIDGLTRIYNRRYMDDRLASEWGRSLRQGDPLCVVMIDVDHFKLYNDFYGHQQGDECLRTVASALKHALWRPCDVLTRYGGEEFACILPDTSLQGAMQVAQRLADAVEGQRIPHEKSSARPHVSVSIGVAVKPAGFEGSLGDLLAAADANLYEAKRKGRAQVCGSELPRQVQPLPVGKHDTTTAAEPVPPTVANVGP